MSVSTPMTFIRPLDTVRVSPAVMQFTLIVTTDDRPPAAVNTPSSETPPFAELPPLSPTSNVSPDPNVLRSALRSCMDGLDELSGLSVQSPHEGEHQEEDVQPRR